MKFALLNPHWNFGGSVYFGCRNLHLPLEYGYAKALLEAGGNDVLLIDAFLESLDMAEIRKRLKKFVPDFTVVTTAPSYLFWRCPPPELRVPMQAVSGVSDVAGVVILVGPHPSTTPKPALEKTGARLAVAGEFEEVLPLIALGARSPSVTGLEAGRAVPHYCDMQNLPALSWPRHLIARHLHHHHRFESEPVGPGAEMEASRGCPYKCSFCSRENFRTMYRKRPRHVVLRELDGLIASGARYIYFIDEIFMPYAPLLEEIALRGIKFGIQTRIDIWGQEMLELLGKAGCVSVEAGVESITEEGRRVFGKECLVTDDELLERLAFAKRHISFVQANLLCTGQDRPEEIESWRKKVLAAGVWANKPVPLFPFPGSPEYSRRWGPPDDLAWERAHKHYLASYKEFSDIQEEAPLPLHLLERNQTCSVTCQNAF